MKRENMVKDENGTWIFVDDLGKLILDPARSDDIKKSLDDMRADIVALREMIASLSLIEEAKRGGFRIVKTDKDLVRAIREICNGVISVIQASVKRGERLDDIEQNFKSLRDMLKMADRIEREAKEAEKNGGANEQHSGE